MFIESRGCSLMFNILSEETLGGRHLGGTLGEGHSSARRKPRNAINICSFYCFFALSLDRPLDRNWSSQFKAPTAVRLIHLARFGMAITLHRPRLVLSAVPPTAGISSAAVGKARLCRSAVVCYMYMERGLSTGTGVANSKHQLQSGLFIPVSKCRCPGGSGPALSSQ
jgi:hypothetical protein